MSAEPISDDGLVDIGIKAAMHGSVTISRVEETAIRARIDAAEARIRALEAGVAALKADHRKLLTHIWQKLGGATYDELADDSIFDRIDALKARALPEPRLIETVEDIEALPDGAYWVALDRMRDTSLPWCLLLRIYGAWVWHGDEIHESDFDLAGAWIVGPLPDPPALSTLRALEGEGNG